MPNSTGLVTEVKNKYTINFFDKQKLVIERGEGVWVYSDMGDKYLDLTSGWAVTCSGHAHPTITQALIDQSLKIIPIPNSQFPIPNSGLTYSPRRAKLLEGLVPILPAKQERLFFTNSGTEANDTALKLARKITGRNRIITTGQSFHGRTLNALAVTGSAAKSHGLGGGFPIGACAVNSEVAEKINRGDHGASTTGTP